MAVVLTSPCLSASDEASNESSSGGSQTGSLRTVGCTSLQTWHLLLPGHVLYKWDALSFVQEYETQSSAEARLVKQFDQLEMILQAHEYEELEGTPGRLQEFFDSTAGTSPARLS